MIHCRAYSCAADAVADILAAHVFRATSPSYRLMCRALSHWLKLVPHGHAKYLDFSRHGNNWTLSYGFPVLLSQQEPPALAAIAHVYGHRKSMAFAAVSICVLNSEGGKNMIPSTIRSNSEESQNTIASVIPAVENFRGPGSSIVTRTYFSPGVISHACHWQTRQRPHKACPRLRLQGQFQTSCQ